MKKYLFKDPLIQGLIKSRPNRFIMHVLIDGKSEKCHCPSTGRIGNIEFKDVPCLLSRAENPERKTKFTVEAISVDSGKNWIGINQTLVNRYIEFFLKLGQMKKLVGNFSELKREVPLGKSRIDFKIDNNYLEVKMPLKDLPFGNLERTSKFLSFDRLIKHFSDVSKSLDDKSERATFVLVYLYSAPAFKVPSEDINEKIVRAAKKAHLKGVETWQVNMKIDKEGVEFLDCFKLNLF